MAESSDKGSNSREERRLLLVGLVCVDIINVVKSFPVEDSDQRCLDCIWQRGGNASTNATVLSMLGTPSSYTGTVAQSQEIHFIKADFEQHGVDYQSWVVKEGASCPVSIIILNRQNGSRTVLHSNKGLPELSIAEFQELDLSKFYWVHFEGRPNFENIKAMIKHVNNYNATAPKDKKITLSMEAEKAMRQNLRELFCMVDYVFLSKDFARACGLQDMKSAVTDMLEKWKPRCAVVCGWGEEGAAGAGVEEGVVVSPAFVPDTVVDTLGAGDTFIGAALHALAGGRSLQDAVKLGCQVAGAKCGMQGNAGLGAHLASIGLLGGQGGQRSEVTPR